ncbi:outer membrane protein assembly factor BamB family protein [Novipirellula aureliae]|uniref:outer membrane protein assembly factor BamB family protein n=1 Tax=Novipirellula aureliae TaxID=2527966 RepID=UPI0018CCD4F3|nr:PQQ-binding-like beta-propeller repeat protein [Novipirellula aureliae]
MNTVGAIDFLTVHQASRLGLVEAWQRQITLPAGASSIVDQKLYVHNNLVREYIEVVRADDEENVLLRIPTDRVDSSGNEIGKEEAERLARNEVRRFKRRGIEAKIASSQVPIIRLYTLADDGTVESRDAETGEVVWMVRVGERRYKYLGMGVGDKYATVINGGNVIELDAANGETIASVPVANMPIYGALQVGDYSIFATIQNGIEAYSLSEPDRVPFRETVIGQALAIPTRAPQSNKLAWTTDREYFYCMEASGNPSLLFRLKTDGIVSGRVAAASGDRFYFGSEAGQIYGVRGTRSGEVMWSKPYGEPFYETPIIAGKQVLIHSAFGNLLSLDMETGDSKWEHPATSVDKLIGMINGKVFASSLTGSLVVIDLETGQRIATMAGLQPSRILINTMTNRLYLIGRSGYVQCLHAEGAVMPTFQEAYQTKSEEQEEAQKEDEKKPEQNTPGLDAPGFGTPADPFGGGGADPFGNPDDGGAAADPFGGGGADPFGGGGADPFGADPFGN